MMSAPSPLSKALCVTTLAALVCAASTSGYTQEKSSGNTNVREADTQTTYERRFSVMKGMMEGALSQLSRMQYCHDRQLFYNSAGYCMNPVSGDHISAP